MKPIFEKERVFLEDFLGVHVPTECWRKGNAIYLDMQKDSLLYRFKIEDDRGVKITKDESKKHKTYIQKGWDYWIKKNTGRLQNLEEISTSFIRDFVLSHPHTYKYVLSYSSGKDSTMVVEMWLNALKKYPEIQAFLDNNNIPWEIQMANTSNDTAETYKNVKNTLPKILNARGYGVNLKILKGAELIKTIPKYEGSHTVDVVIANPEVGFYDWLIHEKDFFIPTVLVRNCCSTYKEGQTSQIYPNDKEVVLVSGVRKFESAKRAKYDYIMDDKKKLEIFNTNNQPKKWISIAPIVEWKNEDVWLYIMKNKTEINPMYYMGYHRVGCLICPFQQDYIDEVTIKHYPKQWDRWKWILEQNYKTKNVKDRLKWTLEEYQNGKWKVGLSKVYEITRLKNTPERIKEVSEILGVSEEIASKYFDRQCSVCNKNLNPTEIAMFLKLFGRFEGIEDNRDFLCRKHICEKAGIKSKEYAQMTRDFIEGGCDLF